MNFQKLSFCYLYHPFLDLEWLVCFGVLFVLISNRVTIQLFMILKKYIFFWLFWEKLWLLSHFYSNEVLLQGFVFLQSSNDDIWHGKDMKTHFMAQCVVNFPFTYKITSHGKGPLRWKKRFNHTGKHFWSNILSAAFPSAIITSLCPTFPLES